MIQRISWIWPNIHHISLEAAEKAEKEKAIFGVIFKAALTLRSLRALREKSFFISCFYALRTNELP